MENETKIKASLKGKKKHFLPFLLFFGFLFFSLEAKAFLFWSGKEIAKIYPAEIRGNWERTRNAQGQANVLAEGEGDKFSQYNSAIYREGAKSLIAGEFSLVDDEAPIKSEEEEIIEQAEQWLEENDPSFEAEKEKDAILEAEKATENNPEEQEIEVLSEPEAGAEGTPEISPQEMPTSENISPEELLENENSTENPDPVSFWKKIPTFLRGEIAWAKEQLNFAQLSNKKFSSASLKLSLAVLEKRAGEVVVETEEDKELGEGIVPVAKIEDVDFDSMAIIYYSQDGESWTKLDAISYGTISNGQNGEYFSYPLPFVEKWEDFQTLQVRVEGVVGGEVNSVIYLDSLWVETLFEESDVEIAVDDMELSGEKTDWRMGEKPKFKIKQQLNFFSQVKDFVLFWKPDMEMEVGLFSVSRGKFELEEGKDYVIENKDDIVIRFISMERISPGEYTLQTTFKKGDFSQTLEQDFTWGVLAMNSNKSIYAPGETGALAMAVLDEKGAMVCDAKVTLWIRNEKLSISDELSTENGKIMVNPECELKDFTLKPDYAASYDFGPVGNYVLELEALTKNGVYSITDNIEVKKNVLFDVERITATRIYPPASYPVTLRISANKDFKGEVRETVPASFSISKLEKSNMVDFAEERTEGEERTLIWNIVLKKGESVSLGYQFDAPDVSPELYLLGPLQFIDKNLGLDFLDRLVFAEARQWQIAADAVAPNGLLIYSDSTTASTKYRTLTNPTTLSAETSDGLGLSTDASNEVLRYSTTKNEFIAGQQHDDGKIVVRTFNGSSWTTQMNLSGLVATTRVDRRAFDIEYERMSGEAMWIYAGDPTTGRVYYCIYDGNSWGPVSNCAPTNGTNDILLNDGTTALTGVPTKIKLKKGRPGSDGLWLQVEDANADLYVAHWDGSSWVAADDITASTALSCDDADTSAPYVDHGTCFGLGVESLSEDPVLFYTEAATMYYRTFNRGTSTWSSPVSGLTLSSYGNWLFVSSDEESDRMAIASGAQGNDFRPIIWKANGTTAGLTSGNADTGAESMAGNNVDGFWEKRPGDTTRQAMFVFTDSNLLRPDHETATCTSSGCSFSSIEPITATNDCADDCSALLLRGNPNGNDMILTGSDIDGDLAMWRWSGTAWALLQKNLSTAGFITPHTSANTTNYTEFPHWFEYYAYSPWSHNWRWYDDEGTAEPTTALANENVAPTDLARGNSIRLRMSIINPTGAGQTDARKKLQYSTDQSTWTDVDAQAGSGIWRYCNGAGTDDAAVTSYKLTAPSAPLSTNRQYGPFVENGTAASTFDHTAVYTAEFDYCVENNSAAFSTTYYFRAFDNDQNDPVDKFQAGYPATSCAGSVACSYPSLTTDASSTNISGTSNATSGTVKVAIDGTEQTGKTGSITSNSWTISGVDFGIGAKVVTVWIDGVGDSAEATAVAKYDGVATSLSGMVLDINILTVGSTDSPGDLDITELNLFDCSQSEDVMHQAASDTLSIQGGSCAGSVSNSYSDPTVRVLAGSALVIAGARVFADKVDKTTGTNPRSVAIGDLNNDGWADLAVANYGSTTVSTFINNGNGTFADKVDKTTGTSPYSVAIGDINNDGWADLAVANYDSTTVSTFINNGNGTFADKVDKTTGTNPHFVAIGDLNNDGWADLAVANYGSTTVSTFINNGNGTFADKVDKTTGTNPRSVAIGDLNNDGWADLAVANYGSNSVSTFLNNGNGTFADKVDKTTGSNPRDVAIGDLNNDGWADLAVANYNTPYSVSTFLNNGDGTFADKVDKTTGSLPISVAIGDLNNDGWADLAVANYNSTTVSTFTNNSNGTFADKVDKTTGSQPYSVAIGDLNNDGWADMAVANGGSTSVSTFLSIVPGILNAHNVKVDAGGTLEAGEPSTFNISGTWNVMGASSTNGPGAFFPQKSTVNLTASAGTETINLAGQSLNINDKVDKVTGSQPWSVAIGDLNNDGWADMAVANGGSTTVSIFLNNGNGTFSDKVDKTTGTNPCSVAIGDLNNDGWADLAVANNDSYSVSTFTNNGNGTFADKVDKTTGGNPRDVAIGDLNNDGWADLATANYGSTSVSTLLNNGNGTFADKVDKTTGSGPHSVAIGDLNNDGWVDLAVANEASTSVSTLLNNGNGTFADKVDKTTGTSPWSVAIGDINNDGWADLATANGDSTSVSTFTNNGNGTFADKVDKTTGTTPFSVAIGDINDDGWADLAVVNYGSASVSTLLNNGNGTFAEKVDKKTGTNPRSVAIGDINNDGWADLAVANYGSTTVSTFLNNGNGTFADKVDKTTGTSPYSVAIGDINNDGWADLAVANSGSTTVSTFLNNGNGTFADKVDKATGTTPYSVAIGDLNNDGWADLAVANAGSTSVSTLLNNGNGTFADKVDKTTGTSPYSVAIGDINNDGWADLAVANLNSTSVSTFLNNGNGTFADKVDKTTGTNPRSVAIGDINNDGWSDLAVANGGSATISTLLNNHFCRPLFFNLNVGSSGSGTWNLTSSIRVLNSFAIASGTLGVTRREKIYLDGNWSNSGTFNPASGTVFFTASSGTQTLDSGGTGSGKTFSNLTHAGAGTLQLSTNDVKMSGNFSTLNGTFDANSRNQTVGGDFTNGGTFTPGSTTLTLDGTAKQRMLGTTSGSSSLYNLTVTNAATAGVNLTNSTTVGGTFNDNTPNSKLIFTTGKTFAFANVDIDGSDGNNVVMTSTNAVPGTASGPQWYFNVTQTSPTVSYVSAYDSDALGGNQIIANTSFNGGNDENWLFTATGGVTVSGTVYTDFAKTTNIGANKTVHLFVNSTNNSTVETDANGAFTFSNITVAANDSVVAYLDEETENGSTVTLALDDTTDITSLDIITDHVTLEHRATGPITNTDLDDIDAVDTENEDGITIATGNATFASGFKLYVLGGETYTPGGTVTTTSSATSTASAGDIQIGTGATFNVGANAVSCGGDWDNDGTFTFSGAQTVTFTATGADFTISDGGSAFYNLTFSDTGGEWLYRDGTSTAPNQTSVSAGTVNFFNAKTGTRSVTGGTLNVDWYLGTHVVNKNNTSTNIDTGDNDITVSEISPSSTVWSWSSPSNLALTTVDTSANLSATGYGNHYTWHDGSRYWLGFMNNVMTSNAQAEYWYSTDGSSWTQNTNATISITNMNNTSFPHGANMDCDSSTNCFAFYNSGATPSLYAVKAASYPGTGFSWGSATEIYAGVNFSYAIGVPQFSRDGDDKFHLTFLRLGILSDVGAIHERFASSANDVSAWGTTSDLEAYDETRRKASRICRLAGNDMYYIVGNFASGVVEGKKYVSGTGWDSSATTVVSDHFYTASTGTLLQYPGLVGNPANDEAYMLYINSSNNVVFKKYIDGSGWQTGITLDSGTSSIIPKLVFNSDDSSLYAFWVSDNKIYYKKGTGSFGSSDWDSSATELASPGTITAMSTSKEVQNGYITFAITTGTASPYDVKFMGLATGANSWNSGSSKTTGTDSTGKNPQPENARSLRIREASITSTATCPGAGCTLYRYNLAATAQTGYNAYNYYSDHGSKYLTSCWANGASCSNDTTNDDVIGDSWHRSAMGTMNSPYTTVNEPSTNGSWYVGLTPTATGVTVSGTVWTNEAKTTNIGANKTVHLFVNGTDNSTAETDANGAFTFGSITVAANDSVVVYLDEETENGSSVTLALDDTTDITSLDIITDHITLDHRSTGPITNTDLDDIDAVDAENEDGVAIATGNATFASGLELVINTNKTYTPGGTVTTNASATSSSQDGDIYISSGATFNVGANAVSCGGDWDNDGTFTKTTQTTTFTATGAGFTISDGGSAFYNLTFSGTGGEWLYKDGTSTAPNQTSVIAGTATFLNAKTGTVSVTGGTLNQDWYLGTHIVNAASTSTNVDTADDDVTISEAGSNATVWAYNAGWGTPAATKTTGTGTDGKNPQPETTGAIRIREYSMTASATCPGAGCTIYRYNEQVDWTGSYGEYDYYDDYGTNYLTSCLAGTSTACSDDSTDDDVIGVSWYRTTIGTMNSPEGTVNEPTTNGSWYVGMLEGLSFSIDSFSKDYGTLNPGGNPTDLTNTLTVTTSSTHGYVIYARAEQSMTCSSVAACGTAEIPDWSGSNSAPSTWNNGSFGFGYSTNDTSLQGGTADRFSGPKFAAFIQTGYGDPVADRTGPSSSQANIITYRIAVDGIQNAGTYQASIVYVVAPTY